MKRIFTLMFVSAALTGCMSKSITQTIYVMDSNGTTIRTTDQQEKPVDVGRGLSATLPIGGF